MTDVKRLMHLLEYLVSTGRHQRGEKPPRVPVSAERRGREWVFSIHEEGLSIAPIDLAICSKMVERSFGGRMWVGPDNATFHFVIPDTRGLAIDESPAADIVERPQQVRRRGQ